MTISYAPLVVIGSVNADIYVEVERLPIEGETIAARSGQTFPGGKGANQAACAARLSYPTFFCGQVHATLMLQNPETTKNNTLLNNVCTRFPFRILRAQALE